MHLVAALLVIIMFSLVSIFLRAELSTQAKLKAQNELPISVESTPPPQSKRHFWGRFDQT